MTAGVHGAWDTGRHGAAEGSTGQRGTDTQIINEPSERHDRGKRRLGDASATSPARERLTEGRRLGASLAISPERQHHSAHDRTCRSRYDDATDMAALVRCAH